MRLGIQDELERARQLMRRFKPEELDLLIRYLPQLQNEERARSNHIRALQRERSRAKGNKEKIALIDAQLTHYGAQP